MMDWTDDYNYQAIMKKNKLGMLAGLALGSLVAFGTTARGRG